MTTENPAGNPADTTSVTVGRRSGPGNGVAGLTVLYDSQCPVCRRARQWVSGQATHLPIGFVAAGSDDARRLFPTLDHGATLRDITVVDDRGGVYRGERAWIMVLWAVVSTRGFALDVARGRKGRLFRGVVGAAETARRITANTVTPPPPAVPPPPFDGWNAPGAFACDGSVQCSK